MTSTDRQALQRPATQRGRWVVAASRQTGTSHRAANRECEDAYEWATPRNGVLVAAVADGAGSCRMSALGSRIAARTAVGTLSAACSDEGCLADDSTCREVLLQAATAAKEALIREAESSATDVKTLATTLILTALTCDTACAIQIGDGAAVIGRPTEVVALTKPKQGDFVNETFFLTTGNVADLAQIAIHRGDVQCLALFTDGLQSLALELPSGRAFAPFFHPLFQFIRSVQDNNFATQQLVALLKSPRFTNRTDDDLTLVLAGWKERETA